MTVPNAGPSATLPSANSGGNTPDSGQAKEKAQMAADQASGVASTAADNARNVAAETSTQAKAVVSQAKDQVQSLAKQTKGELLTQADSKTIQAASGLRTLSEQIVALREGRPSQAGPLQGYLDEAQTKVSTIASRIEQGGPQGVLDDLTAFARRRPGMFLLGAVGAGFLAGRVIRSSAAVVSEQNEQNEQFAQFAPAPLTSPTAPTLPAPQLGDAAVPTMAYDPQPLEQLP